MSHIHFVVANLAFQARDLKINSHQHPLILDIYGTVWVKIFSV